MFQHDEGKDEEDKVMTDTQAVQAELIDSEPQQITEQHQQPEILPATRAAARPVAAVPVASGAQDVQIFEFQQRAARLFATSGLFSDIKGQSHEQSIAQAFVKIALGQSMGFSPAESMTGIDIVQGRTAIGASLRAARMQRAGFSWRFTKHDDKGCIMRVFGPNGEELGESAFTAEDATRAGLLGKDNYKKNPKNMFFSRAITNAQRWYAPGVLGADLLSSEEAIDLEPLHQEPQEIRMPVRKSAGQS